MPAGGDIIYASDLNDVIAMLPRVYSKPNTTSRNTTTTYADDPDLQGIFLEAGSYEIELMLFFSLATTTTQKIKTQWGFTGTWVTSRVRHLIGPGQANTAAADSATSANYGGASLTGTAVYDVAASGGAFTTAREICGTVSVSVAGNMSLQWAQNASSGNNTTVHATSYFRVQRYA